MIEITMAKINYVKFERTPDGEVKVEGQYSLMSSKGDVMAKQCFNGYADVKLAFNGSFAKNVIDSVEEAIDFQLGINKEQPKELPI